jgi:hypothetical protein
LTGYKKLLKEKQKDIDSLYEAIKIQRETIVEYHGKDSLFRRIDSLNAHVATLQDDKIKILTAEIKRGKRQRTGDNIKQGIIIGILGYLSLKK